MNPGAPAPVLAAWLADAARTLAFERSRAESPWQALQAWAAGQRRRLQRWRGIGSAAFGGLLQAEGACARAGLNYPAEDRGQTAPWHLPERYWRIGPGALPAHPVIDPQALAAATAGLRPVPNAAQALQQLAEIGAGSVHWRTLPLLPSLRPQAGHAPAPKARIAVCLHLFYPELWPVLHAQLKQIPEPWDLFVTVPAFAATAAWQAIARDHPGVRFLPLPNRGRDVAPWLQLLRSGALDGYDAACKLHGKRSPHMQGGGDAWRDAIMQALLGSAANVDAIVARFRADPALAVLGPGASQRRLVDAAGWEKNRRNVELLSKRLQLGPLAAEETFFAGTMFWFRPAAFERLRNSSLQLDDFPLEMGQTEGTVAHALERLLAASTRRVHGHVLAWPHAPAPC